MLRKGEHSNNSKTTCIIVGGGITGLITATVLQRQGMQATVLDKGRGIGGRLATRRIKYSETIEGVFDYGTQYFSAQQPQFQVWVDEWLQQKVIKRWFQDIRIKDGKSRYCGVEGTRGIAKYLAQSLDVYPSTKVTKLSYENHWRIQTETGKEFEGDILVITAPVPQSLALLDDSHIVIPSEINKALKKVSYHPCIAVLALLEKPSHIPSPGGLSVKDDSLVWLASNYQKGISPHGYGVTLHSTPGFSDAFWDRSDEEISQHLFDAASEWLTSPVIKYQVHRWHYSLPKTFYPEPCLVLPELSLVMAGDAFVAPKIEGALMSGLAAAKAIIDN